MTWFAGIPGLDCHVPLDSQEVAARIAVLACSVRLHPLGLPPAQFSQTPAGKAARKFLPWVQAASDDRDAYLRRLALAFACDQPREDTNDDQVLKIAKFIYAWWAASRARPRGGTG